jgi:CRP-like cAMP-binding protein
MPSPTISSDVQETRNAGHERKENRLLASLPPSERAAVEAAGRAVTLDTGQKLFSQGSRLAHVYFPRGCLLSLTTELADGHMIEATNVGTDGLVGHGRFLGIERSGHAVFAQVPGEALQVPARAIEGLLQQAPALVRRASEWTEVLSLSIAQSGACLAAHPASERCARWLLTVADRTESERFYLTHEFLATMLGATRPTVSIAARTLQNAGLIRYQRGAITILDRRGLLEAACECYAIIQGARREFLVSGGR